MRAVGLKSKAKIYKCPARQSPSPLSCVLQHFLAVWTDPLSGHYLFISVSASFSTPPQSVRQLHKMARVHKLCFILFALQTSQVQPHLVYIIAASISKDHHHHPNTRLPFSTTLLSIEYSSQDKPRHPPVNGRARKRLLTNTPTET